jgi:hypothetical protein
MPWDLRPVGPDFLETAPRRFTNRAVIRRPPERVFDSIAGDPARWGDWFPGFDHSGRWLTPDPPGEGSRRAVRMGGIAYDETILAWERPTRFAFRVDRAGAPFAHALAEDYRIAEHPSGSTLEWTFAIDPRRLLGLTTGLFDPVLSRLFRRIADNLDRKLPA